MAQEVSQPAGTPVDAPRKLGASNCHCLLCASRTVAGADRCGSGPRAITPAHRRGRHDCLPVASSALPAQFLNRLLQPGDLLDEASVPHYGHAAEENEKTGEPC
jgi:hypothetical protein